MSRGQDLWFCSPFKDLLNHINHFLLGQRVQTLLDVVYEDRTHTEGSNCASRW